MRIALPAPLAASVAALATLAMASAVLGQPASAPAKPTAQAAAVAPTPPMGWNSWDAFGIHIVRGIPKQAVADNLPIGGSAFHAPDAADRAATCPWDDANWGVSDNAAGQAWYDDLIRQYASWGVDFLKVDCISDHPYRPTEIRQIALAIQHSGRDVVLSLSPGPTSVEHHAEVAELAQMWRVSNDIWDIWDSGTREYPIG